VRNTRQLIRMTLACGLGLALVAAAGAQTTQQQQQQFGPRTTKTGKGAANVPQAEIVATHGAWRIQCQEGPAGADGSPGKKACAMLQVAKAEKNPKVEMAISLVKGGTVEQPIAAMQAIVPIGVFLGLGIPADVDTVPLPGRLNFVRCTPQVCVARADLKAETLDKFKKGNETNFFLYEAPGVSIAMKFSLEGFSAALADLDNY